MDIVHGKEVRVLRPFNNLVLEFGETFSPEYFWPQRLSSDWQISGVVWGRDNTIRKFTGPTKPSKPILIILIIIVVIFISPKTLWLESSSASNPANQTNISFQIPPRPKNFSFEQSRKGIKPIEMPFFSVWLEMFALFSFEYVWFFDTPI